MAPDNVEIIRSIFDPLEGVNVAAIDWTDEAVREVARGLYTSDAELTTLASGFGTGVGTFYKGADGLAQYLQEWLEPFSEYYLESLDYIPVRDCVLVPSRQWGVGSGSGVRIDIELTTLYELRDGKIVRIHQYDTLEEARKDAEQAQEG